MPHGALCIGNVKEEGSDRQSYEKCWEISILVGA